MAARLKRRVVLAGLAGGALARPAVGGNPRVLRFIPETGLANPDPIATPSAVGRAHGMMVWDLLYGTTAAGEPQPQMAEGHEVSSDGLLWRFTLREGLFFHDGSRVRAADCVASIRRWGARRAFGHRLLDTLDTMIAEDDRRFALRLLRPFPLMLTALGSDLCFIMPERLAASDPTVPVAEIIGSGPYRFLADAFVPGSRAAYARFAQYEPVAGAVDFTAGAKRALVERIEWTAHPDPAAAVAEMQAGGADWWDNPPADTLGTLREIHGLRVVTNTAGGVTPLLAINHLNPPFSNRRLTRALLPALDQQEFMTAAMASEPQQAKTGVGFFPPGSPYATAAGLEALTGPRDIELARRLVQESGYGGETVLLMSPTDVPPLRALTEVASDLFQRIGLIVETVGMEWSTLLQRRASRALPEQGGWSAFATTFPALSLASPATHLPLRGIGTAGWFGWPTSRRLEALRDAWFDATSQRARLRICEEMQKIALAEVPYIPLGHWHGAAALRADVAGVGRAPYPLFWGVKKG
jgi:peptide/nickel transport system substrate-binding protein